MSEQKRRPSGIRKRLRGAVLCVGIVLLAACLAPTPDSSGPTAPLPTATPYPIPVLPTRPSPTPRPTSTPRPTRQLTPPWPTPLPTPTPASPLRPNMQVATFFFYWYDCPAHNCDPAQAYAVPPGWSEPLEGDRRPGDGLYYSSLNRDWYLQELRDMQLAGIGIVLPVSWGEHPTPWFRTGVLQALVEANRLLDTPLRIGLFDDTSSEVGEYNDYLDNGLFDGSRYLEGDANLNLSDPVSGFLFYDRKIKPFFQTIPPEMWATHDGRPVEEGGRPLIVVYSTGRISHLESAGALWAGIKAAFQRDFHDRNGRPITPWLVLETTWFTGDSLAGLPPIDEVADGRFAWGAALNGPKWHSLHGTYTVASVGPGFDNRKAGWVQTKLEQPRHRTPDGQEGDPGTFLRWSLSQIPPQTNLLLVETWNELWEGTNVCRAAFPPIGGQAVPEDEYLNLLREALLGQSLWWAARPLPPSWPERLAPQRTYRLSLALQNTGTRTWSEAGGEHLTLGGTLFPAGQEIRPSRPVRPGQVGLFTIVLETPQQAGVYTFTWQMEGPAGPFGPPAHWGIEVGPLPLTPTLQARIPAGAISPGQTLTLTVEVSPAIAFAEVHLQLRFDPAFLYLAEAQMLPGRTVRRWNVSVDNERGWARLEAWQEAGEAMREIVRLRWRALAPGTGGFWVEGGELWTQDGAAMALPDLWVPLVIEAAVPGRPP